MEWLFACIRELCARAASAIVFTSHRWNEITSIADRITIFRNGAEVGTFTEIDEAEAVTLMTGRQVDAFYPPLPAFPAMPRPCSNSRMPACTVRRSKGVSLTPAGEILGIGGLAGQGHRELFPRPVRCPARSDGAGSSVNGAMVAIGQPADAIHAALGIALVPEDRKTEGLLLPMSVRENLTLADPRATVAFRRHPRRRANAR